jgi:AcrR family transcriptional regulator
MPRKYELKRRADTQAETRRRITEATVELHATVGPANTTISAIAAKAGVQRLTVYRHFAGERELFAACSAHWLATAPPPEPMPWAEITDPRQRLTTALTELYRWYRANEGMLANTERDAPALPALAEIADPAPYLDPVKEILSAGWEPEPAALGHALAFSTWRDLARNQGLGDPEAATLISRLLR